MATPSYTTDLQDVTTADSLTDWDEMSGHTSGGAATLEEDYYIQGSYCISQSTGQKTGTVCGLEYDYGSNISLSTGDCFFFWMIFLAPNAVDTFANGGFRAAVGSSSGNVNFWKVGGNDFGRFPYGGWQNFAVDPTFTADYTDGSPTGSYRIFGSLPNISSKVTKGNPHGVDAIRYGRGEIIIEYGDGTNGYGTFSGIASQNDSQSNRWGLFQALAGSYLWKGLLSFGNSTNACDFRDSNKTIIIDSTPRTYSGFNKIEINNASSRVDWTNISFIVADESQLSRGTLTVVDNADVNFEGCLFVGLDTLTFQSNSDVLNSTFQGTNLIDSGGGNFSGSSIIYSTVAANASAFKWNSSNDPNSYTNGMTFIKGSNAHHAIEFGTSSPLNITLTNITATGFNSSNGQNDSTFYIARTSGTVNITVVSGTGNFSYKSAGATVNLSINQVNFKLTGIQQNSEVTLVKKPTASLTGSGGSTTSESRLFTTGTTMTTDEYKGHLLVIESGSDIGRYYIVSNTTTQLKLDTVMTTTDSGLDFNIYGAFDVVYHVEDVPSSGEVVYNYTYSSDQYIDVLIFHIDYLDNVLEDVLLSNESQAIPISQDLDLNYYNPS